LEARAFATNRFCRKLFVQTGLSSLNRFGPDCMHSQFLSISSVLLVAFGSLLTHGKYLHSVLYS